jgi:hypothetical protein
MDKKEIIKRLNDVIEMLEFEESIDRDIQQQKTQRTEKEKPNEGYISWYGSCNRPNGCMFPVPVPGYVSHNTGDRAGTCKDNRWIPAWCGTVNGDQLLLG